MQEVKNTVKNSIIELFSVEAEPDLTRPEEQFGDYATNVAMQLAPKLGKTPKEIAEALQKNINNLGYYEKVEVAGPGFLNITLKSADILMMANGAANLPKSLEGQEILVEFGDPNPFKEMHIGHLYSYIVGDSISRLFEANGATVQRLSYHGDVGLHVAKAIWGMQNQPAAPGLGHYYAAGAKAYEADVEAAKQIQIINEHIYKKDDAHINELYEQGKKTSFEYFDKILNQLRIINNRRYLESESALIGIDFVRKNIPTVFSESDGAVVFEGERVGLHTRVFITSKGLPTYEAKDLGLAELKSQHYPNANRSIIITANEQSEYFKVMLAALNEFDPALASKTTHLSHGFLSLSTGKMSSRTGEVYSATNLLRDAENETKKLYPDSRSDSSLAAIKYGFLKHRLGGDIIYDLTESVSVEGNSGPYLQYAYARAASILKNQTSPTTTNKLHLNEYERSLARKVSEYPEIVSKATTDLMPHYICTYLYELAQNFNRFYENNRVIGDERQDFRLTLVSAYAEVLKSGLNLLNIEAPERV